MNLLSQLLVVEALFSTEPLIDVQEALGTRWETLVNGIALLGDSRLIIALAVVLFWYVGQHRPYQVLAASLIGAAIGSLIKLLVDLPRPSDPDLLIYSTTTSPSFPSGHVVLATCFWGTLAWYGWIPRWTAAVIVGLVMFARVYLGAHFIGDVLFGALIGAIWLAAFHRFIGPWLQRFQTEWLARAAAVIMTGSFLVLPVSSAFAFGWEIVGGLVGAGIGLVLQERYLRFDPGPVRNLWHLAKVPIGVAGLALIIGLDYLIGPELMVIELAMYFIAAIWGLLLAPIAFKALGLGRLAEPDPVIQAGVGSVASSGPRSGVK